MFHTVNKNVSEESIHHKKMITFTFQGQYRFTLPDAKYLVEEFEMYRPLKEKLLSGVPIDNIDLDKVKLPQGTTCHHMVEIVRYLCNPYDFVLPSRNSETENKLFKRILAILGLTSPKIPVMTLREKAACLTDSSDDDDNGCQDGEAKCDDESDSDGKTCSDGGETDGEAEDNNEVKDLTAQIEREKACVIC